MATCHCYIYLEEEELRCLQKTGTIFPMNFIALYILIVILVLEPEELKNQENLFAFSWVWKGYNVETNLHFIIC